jgi:hypothetical protein
MKCYWNNTGVYQEHSDALLKLIPEVGVCNNANQNPDLEKFRKAVNCYYDLYNNGLCNRAREFSILFRIPGVPREIRQNYGHNFLVSSATEDAIDAKMDAFVLAAYEELERNSK